MKNIVVKWFVVESVPFPEETGLNRGWGNGYIAVPQDSPFWGLDYGDESFWDIEIHGGFTFGSKMDYKKFDKSVFWSSIIKKEDIEGWWVFGFDTAHCSDTLEKWPKIEVIKHTLKIRAEIIKRTKIALENGS